MRQTLISFDLRAGFGVFKKPDVNEGLQLTFNLLHKPALLGILGAIAGLEGYQRRGVFPDYYEKLGKLRVGIEPLGHEKGNFVKTVIKYTNTVGYANADGNLLITEQTLRSPAFRIYLLLDLDEPTQLYLHDRVRAGEADYLPYFGKNECSAWWEKESVKTYDFEQFPQDVDFRIKTIFIRKNQVGSQKVEPSFDWAGMKMQNQSSFIYFERLPIDFFVGDKDELPPTDLFSTAENAIAKRKKPLSFVQYNLAEFAFSDWVLKKEAVIHDLFRAKSGDDEPKIIQLF